MSLRYDSLLQIIFSKFIKEILTNNLKQQLLTSTLIALKLTLSIISYNEIEMLEVSKKLPSCNKI